MVVYEKIFLKLNQDFLSKLRLKIFSHRPLPPLCVIGEQIDVFKF